MPDQVDRITLEDLWASARVMRPFVLDMKSSVPAHLAHAGWRGACSDCARCREASLACSILQRRAQDAGQVADILGDEESSVS